MIYNLRHRTSMSFVSASNPRLVSPWIPCIRPGCLAPRVGSSTMCFEHLPVPSIRHQTLIRARKSAPAAIAKPCGDSANTRPRILRYVPADGEAIHQAIGQRRQSDNDASALGRFLNEQRAAEKARDEIMAASLGQSQTRKLSVDRQLNLERLLSPRPTPDQLRSRNIIKGDDNLTTFHARIRSLEQRLGTRLPREELVGQRIIVDTTNGIQARGDVLKRLLDQRSDPDALVKKNILKVGGDLSRFDPNASDARNAIAVESAKERLERMLRSRPTAKILVAKNILKQTTPAMAERQRRLDRHQRQLSLSETLLYRPSSQQLKDLGIIEEGDEKKPPDAVPTEIYDETVKDNESDEFGHVFVPAPSQLTPDLKSAARVGDSTQFQHVLFVWGQGHHGQLGLNNTRSQPFPTLCRALSHVQIRVVTLGSQHTLALTSEGELFGWGSCARGQLGLGEGSSETVKSPTSLHVSHSPLCNQKTAMVAAGSFHSAFTLIGNSGVFVMGAGMVLSGDVRVPIMVNGLEGIHMEYVACGRQHCVAISRSGDLWTWGRGVEGQLGRGSRSEGEVIAADRIETHSEFWESVVCGGDHTVGVGFDQCVYVWGDNSFGQLGLTGIPVPGHVFEPQQVKALSRKGIVQLACSQNHTAALSDNGTIYSTTIVSRSDAGTNFIRLPPTHCFTSVAAGINATTATTAAGIVYQWQLDQGSLQSQRMTTLEGIDLTSIQGGYRHFAALGRVPTGALETPQLMNRKLDGIIEDDQLAEVLESADLRKSGRRRHKDTHKRHETLVHIDPEMRSVHQD